MFLQLAHNIHYLVEYYWFIDIIRVNNFADAVWPVPTAFVPDNVFERFSNPIEDLPPRENADAKEQQQQKEQ